MLYIYYSKINYEYDINIELFPHLLLEHLKQKKDEKTFKTSVFTWYLFNIVLQKHYKKSLNEINLSFSQNGKPLSNALYFSISHSNDIACVAISNTNVGIDVEKIKPLENLEKLIDTLFEELPFNSNDLLLNFYLAYTSYEAYIKYNDLALGYPKKSLYIREDCKSHIIEIDNDKYVLNYLSNKVAKIREIIV